MNNRKNCFGVAHKRCNSGICEIEVFRFHANDRGARGATADARPISVVAGLFAIIVILIIAFWNRSEAYHHTKHKENDEFSDLFVREDAANANGTHRKYYLLPYSP